MIEQPDIGTPTATIESKSQRAQTAALITLAVLGVMGAMFFARSLLLPIVVALMLNLLLKPIVRWLTSMRIPMPIAGVITMLFLTVLSLAAAYFVSTWLIDFISTMPDRLSEVEYKLRGLSQSIDDIGNAADRIQDAASGDAKQPKVVMRGPTIVEHGLGFVQSLGVSWVSMFVLLFFLLLSGDAFLTKLVSLLPTFKDKKGAVSAYRDVERKFGAYLLTTATINVALGAVTGLALALLGVRNYALWGIVVALLNFVPYIGPVVALVGLGISGLLNFETVPRIIAPAGAFFILNILEAYIFTPMLVGRRLDLNPVAVILSLLVWSWMWGVTGAILAVPLLALLRVMGDHFPPLRILAEFSSGTPLKIEATEEQVVEQVAATPDELAT
ncbi:MAG: AI-2E family transporter [Phycisphaerales bacterium]